MPLGKKWREKSVYQVLTRLRDAAEGERALFVMQMAIEEQTKRLHREAKLMLKELADELTYVEVDHIRLGSSWKCPDSPTDNCIYDDNKDPFMDHCLFCGEPVDRG